MADNLLAQLQSLQQKALEILAMAEDKGDPARVAQGLRAFHARLVRTDFATLERGEIAE